MSLHAHLDRQAAQAHRSPTEAQKKAGNYRHGHVKAHGLDVTIENARGSKRRGVDAGGKPWSVTMPHHYGYIKGTTGADDDHVDTYIGPHLKSPRIFVVDQKDAGTGAFDEHKAFMGFATKQQVQRAYRACFSDGKADQRMGHITEMTVPEFKEWLRDGDTKSPLKRAAGGRIPHMAEGGALLSDADMGIGGDEPAGKVLSDADMGLTKDEPAATWGSVATQAGLGIPRGVADSYGLGVDSLTLKPLRDTVRGAAAFIRAPEGEGVKEFNKAYNSGPEYSAWVRDQIKLDGENAPKNFAERVASGAGEGLAGAAMGGPGGPVKALVNMASGAVGGSTGRTAAEFAPEKWKPLAELAGNVVGGVATAGAASAPGAAKRLVSRATEPLTAEGQQTIAGRVLQSRSAAPDDLEQSLNASAWPRVEGSQPTTFQLTGDMGLGALEREVATQNPAAFMERRAQQNSARADTLEGLQPTGDPQAVSAAVRQHVADVETMTQRAVDNAMVEAQTRARELGGTQNQEAYGNTLRTALNDAENAARTQERALWNAVDPDGDLTMNMAPVQNSVERVYGDLSQASQASLKPIERQVLDVIGEYGPIESFRELTDLRSLVSSTMREELVANGRTPAYARLSQLRGGIEQSINGAVADRATADAANVAAGRIAPEQSIAANIERQVAEWQAERAAGQRASTGTGEAAPGGPTSMSPAPGGPRAPELGPTNAARDTGVPDAPPVVANFDQAAAARLREASAATRDRAQTFGAEPLKGITKREGTGGPYRMRESAVPSKIFHPGDTGFEDVARYRAAVGDEQALPVLRDYAASSLREAAMTPEGIVDPARFARWQAQHSEAMRAFPELGQQFENAAQATRLLGDVRALQRTAVQEAQSGALGRVMGLTDPQDVTRAIGSILNGPGSIAEMRRLVAQTRGNPAAVEGLRKAVADHITQKFMSNTEAATSGRALIKSDQFQTFIKNNEPALALVFNPQEVAAMRAVAADLQRANRSVTAVKLPGQSNTAQDVSGVLRNGTGQSWLGKLMVDGAAGLGGFLASSSPTVAMASAGIAHVANAIRGAGFKKVDDLVKEAMLNPELARVLVAKAASKNTPAADRMLARRITAITAASLARDKSNEEKKQ